MRNLNVVVGMGFGDEGKGRVTDYLCQQSNNNPLVVRFNGGNQAAHTVVVNGNKHVFSSFGSGTLRGVPSYFSSFCSIEVGAMMQEYEALRNLGVEPMLYVDALCPVTTPFEVIANQKSDEFKTHGTCGVGFGLTMKRHEETPFRLYAVDLLTRSIWTQKIRQIARLYPTIGLDVEKIISEYSKYVAQFVSTPDIMITSERKILRQHTGDLIFEGAQGVLLDREFGYFPNVTRSHTTSRNAVELIERNNLQGFKNVYHVTRCYHTRHGHGTFTDGDIILNEKFAESETNQTNQYQGEFRLSPFNFDYFRHARRLDLIYSEGYTQYTAVTCLDQLVADYIPYIMDGELSDYELPLSKFFNLVSTGGNIIRFDNISNDYKK